MKSTVLWAGIGAIAGHFIEIFLFIIQRPNMITDSTSLINGVAIPPAIFALPIYGAIIGIFAFQLTRSVIKN